MGGIAIAPAHAPRRRTAVAPALLALALAVLLLAACSKGESEIAIEKAWLRTPPPGAPTAAVYMTVRNTGTAGDRLLAVATPVAERASLHRSLLENGIMRMRPVESIAIPAGASVALEPGGHHIMLEGLVRAPEADSTIMLTLRFERAGEMRMSVPVRPDAP